MKRKRPRKTLSVSLFPFLAVLICTFGVLITLLVLAVRSAEVQAANERKVHREKVHKDSTKLKQLGSELDEVEMKVELISENRHDALAELSKSREYRGHLEAEIRKLKETIETLDEDLAQIESNEAVEIDVEQTKFEIEQLTQKVWLAEKELSEKRQVIQANSRVTYSIVPHAGNGSTFRRPIFIETKGESITIQPFGIELRSDDFVPPLGPGNPLDAAVLAIREYWQKHELSESSVGSPYPLIVIRPDGSEGYAISRRALVSWEDEFGYELVENDKELNFGEVDAALKAVVEDAVAEARLRQQKMLAARIAQQPRFVQQAGFRTGQARFNRGSTRESDQRPGLTVSGTGGGFVVNSGWEELYNQSGGLAGTSMESGLQRDGTNAGSGHDRFSSGTRSMNGEPNGLNSSTGFQAASNRGNQSFAGQADKLESVGNNNRAESATGLTNAGSGPSGNSQAGQAGQAGSSNSNGQGGAAGTSASGGQGQDCESCSQPSLMYQHMSVAKSKGRDWAVPNKSPGSVAYVRPIRIVCTESELEVLSPLGVEKRIPIEGRVEDAIDPLVNEIWRQIESWGIPGARSHWKPELKISVVAGGEKNFEKLQGLLFESGVQVKESQR